MTQTQFYGPHPLLKDLVNCIMVIDAESPSASTVCVYPPTPQASLFFYIHDRVKLKKDDDENFILQPRSVVVGLQSEKVVLDVQQSHKAVRVGFHPGGLHRLLGFGMQELIDGSYDASDVFGSSIDYVNNDLAEAKSFDEIKNVVERFLLEKRNELRKPIPFDSAMLEVLKANGNISMDRAASLACLSLRQFERVSRERLGMSPKLFARVVRFSHAYRMYERFPEMSWTKIAHSAGYYDQMHFIRDFKQFTGLAPREVYNEFGSSPVRLQAELRL
ncbi:MAG: AraC family transcriptional regulator [Chitinophagaceae bacterium]|nr:MAG: AraC family transcriptional regulator [Chitinophagaceae bacterium]